MIVIKKNRIEKGIREKFIGSKPHSKGEIFSRSNKVFLEIVKEIFITIVLIIKMIKIIIIKFKIICTN